MVLEIARRILGDTQNLKRVGENYAGESDPVSVQIAGADPQMMAETVKQSMIKHLAELRNQPVTQLLDARQARLRGFGVFGNA